MGPLRIRRFTGAIPLNAPVPGMGAMRAARSIALNGVMFFAAVLAAIWAALGAAPAAMPVVLVLFAGVLGPYVIYVRRSGLHTPKREWPSRSRWPWFTKVLRRWDSRAIPPTTAACWSTTKER